MPAEPIWSTLKPSSAPALSMNEVRALPDWMVVVLIGRAVYVDRSRSRGGKDVYGVPRIVNGWAEEETWNLEHPSYAVHFPRLPRLSFALTTDQVRRREKTVTRRMRAPRWARPGRWFLAVDKVRQAGAQGLAVCRAVSVRREVLADMNLEDLGREGFPEMERYEFFDLFLKANGLTVAGRDLSLLAVDRLEFRYFDPEVDR